jgi:hypothetical protein
MANAGESDRFVLTPSASGIGCWRGRLPENSPKPGDADDLLLLVLLLLLIFVLLLPYHDPLPSLYKEEAPILILLQVTDFFLSEPSPLFPYKNNQAR